jgi:taurine dioxygenase
MGAMQVRRLGYVLGAEVTGLDLRRDLDDATVASVRDAWLEHLVLVFPGQDLSAEQHVAFSRRFGALDDNEATPYYRHPDHPEILLVTNKQVGGKPSQTRNTGRNWHSDLSYTARPAVGSLLLCKEKPDVGGDTMFTNMYRAYETLSPLLRDFLDTLWAVHDVTLVKGFEKRDPAQVAEIKRLNPPVAHPVARIHPETGRRALYVGDRVRQFVGMTEEESQPLLQFLVRHAVSDDFVYRHRWTRGDIVMWDNRCTMHIALPDFDQTQPRHMLRCSLKGDRIGRVWHGEDSVAALAPPEQAMRELVAAVS